MTTQWKDIARANHEGSESGAIPFPQSVRMLVDAGFDGYAVDLRRATRTYYMPDGGSIELESAPTAADVAPNFDAQAIKAALSQAQALVPGYTYQGFCAKVAAAGCAGYYVSLAGQRVLYFGRTGESLTECFPGATP